MTDIEKTDPAAHGAPGATGAESRVVASRRLVEERLDELRSAVRERVGARLERRAWALPLLAAAVGFSLALWLRGRRRRSL